MKQATFWLLILALAVAGSAFYFWQYFEERARQEQLSVNETQPAVTAKEEPQEPEILYPVPQAPLPSDTSGSEQEEEQEPPLPSLDKSDPVLKKEFSRLFDPALYGKLFIFQQFVNRFVVTVDNLTGAKLPQKYQVARRPQGYFLATKNATERQFIDPANYQRYEPYVRFMEAMDTKAIAAVYVRYYPLFQQAYEDLGYPKQYFNDRLIGVIDNLLATPEVTSPVELKRPSVYYKFADPDLEALSAGQKILIRMGPENALKVKSKLTELRRELATLSSNL